ncbi:MAG TPA: S46 family peptidase [Lacibacter sp.]|nr:S46 family peptidase [Lacibacter sp.]HMO88282.1 S46 family peptidase [Lacibacter sp.]HMP86524.1 S46 family peptidase [Lacibacter sp.]
MRLLKLIPVLFLFSLSFLHTRADEGMWLPLFLEQLNEKQMRSMGMKITAKDIYNINKGSLKDAIVSFGGFCTGEVISNQGLVLTNHHCGFDAIQNHSTLERNYIRDGFWARNRQEEIPNPGLFVTFIIRIEEVTTQVLAGVTPAMNERERQSRADQNISALRKQVPMEPYQDCFVRAFFEGNRYFLFVTEQYNDVRLVGAPPSSIGNFGKDTDNWMWPRHTGDFSLFRIYAGKDNKPAAYSPDNVPYVPRRSLAISLQGVREGDFTMVMGFPGRTTQYLPSVAVEQIVQVFDPLKIGIRDQVLAVMDGFMRRDEQVKIQYAAKYASVSNAWKKWQGEVRGLTATNAVQKKRNYEAVFQQRVEARTEWKVLYGTVLAELEQQHRAQLPYAHARDVFNETMPRIELFTIAAQYHSLVNAFEQNGQTGYNRRREQVRHRLEELFKELDLRVDRSLFQRLVQVLRSDPEMKFLQPAWERFSPGESGTVLLEAVVYEKSKLGRQQGTELLDPEGRIAVEAIKQDPGYQLYLQLVQLYGASVTPRLNEYQAAINRLQRTYMQAQTEVMTEKIFYPDANSTLRVTYGKVSSYQPRDAVQYSFMTYLDGVLEKYKPGDYEFDVDDRLQELYRQKDYGLYGVKGRMPVCFIAMNHTTGGNSGSPALDARGNLVGLNFDRAWEGTMSDINYDPSICRNIMVDIRYILFIIDKYAGAGHLVQEMNLVRKKR